MSRIRTAAALLVGAAALAACTSTTQGTPVADVGTTRPTANDQTVTMPPPTTTSASSSCDYRSDGQEPARDVDMPSGTDAPKTVTLATDHGDIPMAMSADTPCTTASIAHLAKSGFYDDTPCHRLTKADSLSVLQCGDPSGTGTGGPGYTLPDENPTDLKPAGQGDYVVYPRGTVAMANTGAPHSGGSQFFLVYADSVLPPTYAVFATVDDEGLAVLDKITKAGVQGGGSDGAPATPVKIQQAKAD
ncbi:peptidylprolyl isomerase [Actinokineospora soli]|uniref:Peptidylprolyl isomerase n=1 Tax=Actinokineospora soli TaxID=1048753 RepID=A0ABW2TKB6_9PSEU